MSDEEYGPWEDTVAVEGGYAPDKAGWYEWRHNELPDERRLVALFDEYGSVKMTLEAFEFFTREAGYHRVSGPNKQMPPEGFEA